MKFKNGLFIFRRDYRIIDNVTLNLAMKECENLFTIFIFTPEQVVDNTYKSNNAVQFMIESLQELSKEINTHNGKLYTFYGDNNKVIQHCVEDFKIDAVFFNADYTPYAVKRDKSINTLCEKLDVKVFADHDYYLNPPGTIFNLKKEPYQKFTPYYNSANIKNFTVPYTYKNYNFKKTNYDGKYIIPLNDAMKKFTSVNPNILVNGGRTNAKKTLSRAIKTQDNYAPTHNNLNFQTSTLSAYIKFGCLSIREVYLKFKNNKDFVRQLIWRDFFANILFSFPQVLKQSLKPKYDDIKWSNTRYLNKWKTGTTGFPIIDAGMREMNTTGYMHNRARLIVASFLVKTLMINWRHGEKYFSQTLTDYDVASNNGNWQWIMGGGADSQPYFRIFNPWNQSKEYDKDATYIKKWVPELEEVPPKDIHNWYKVYDLPDFSKINYPKPIVDYDIQKLEVLEKYKAIF
jgi:deoxyribodipyrimidine photo-lyase